MKNVLFQFVNQLLKRSSFVLWKLFSKRILSWTIKKIKNSIPNDLSLEEKAHFAFEARTKIILVAREKMEDLKGRALLPEGKTFEELLAYKMDADEGKGLSYSESITRYYWYLW